MKNKIDYNCPVCGASITFESAMCSVCKVGVDWINGKPISAIKGKKGRIFWISTIAIIAIISIILLLLAINLI
jgi:hypothetical protein